MIIFNIRNLNLFHKLLRDEFISSRLLLQIFLILSLMFQTVVEAQQVAPPPPENFYTARFSPSMAIIIVILIAALFFMGFFSIYIRHCSQNPTGQTIRQTISMRRRGAAAAARGLDASVIETFPTFSYAEVKDQRIGKGALECAVCLNEFEDNETLRLIPKCDHVFHPECIDAWLESHVTCPVCRADLVPVEAEVATMPVLPPVEDGSNSHQTELIVQEQPRNDDVSIRVDCAQEEQNARPEVVNPGLIHSGSLNRTPRSWSVRKPKMFGFGKFRSHSTGHSLVVPGENLDRFTLRLPEGVRKEMLNRALLNRNESCARRLQGEGSTRGGNRTGLDGSNRGVRFNSRTIDIPDRASRSDRWTFLTRAFSTRSPKVTDNTSSSTSKSPRTMGKMPSFKCLEPKSSDEIETSLVRSDSARPPV